VSGCWLFYSFLESPHAQRPLCMWRSLPLPCEFDWFNFICGGGQRNCLHDQKTQTPLNGIQDPEDWDPHGLSDRMLPESIYYIKCQIPIGTKLEAIFPSFRYRSDIPIGDGGEPCSCAPRLVDNRYFCRLSYGIRSATHRTNG